MQIYVESQRGIRYLVSEGWSTAPTHFDNEYFADLLATFPRAALDQIYDRFLAHQMLLPVGAALSAHADIPVADSFPGVPTHFTDEHRAVYTAVRQYRILIEEAPLSESTLDDKQSGLRHKIRMGLQKIIAEERAEAARIQVEHDKRSELGKLAVEAAHVAKGLGQAAWGLGVWAKDIAEVAMLVSPVRMQSRLASATYDYYANDKSFEASSSEYLGRVKKEIVDVLGFDPSTITAQQLEQAFEVAHLVYDDDTLRSDIGRFAKDYMSAQHRLEIAEFAGAGVFEIILTLVLAAFTGGVGGVAAMAKNGRLMFRFREVGDLVLDFARLQRQRMRLKNRRGTVSSAANFSDLDADEVSVPKYSDEIVGNSEAKRPRLPVSDAELAKMSGNTPAQVRARRSLARDYMENNGFTEDQIKDALGTVDGVAEGGVDFDQPLEVISFPPPEYMYQYVNSHGYPGNWFDPVGGQSADQLGISGEGRMLKQFKMPKGTGLKSHSRPILDRWTNPEKPIQTNGGGIQLIVNDDSKSLVNTLNGLD